MRIDLRQFAYVPPALVELAPAPRLAPRTLPPGLGAPRAFGRALGPGGWGLPSPVAPPELEGGVTAAWGFPDHPPIGPAAFGAELPTTDQLSAWWSNLMGQLHQFVYRRGAQAVTGISVPEEAADPDKARAYLADLLEQLAKVHSWPPSEVAVRAAMIRTMPSAGTVVATVERVKAVASPPSHWPGVEGWYTVAGQLQQAAGLVSAGEAAGLLRRAPAAAAEQVREGWRTVQPTIERGIRAAEETSRTFRSVGTGLGVGFGATTALVGLGALALVGGWFFGPEIAAGGKALATAKAAKDRRKAK